ncbi:MAG: cyclase family protein, partial [Firmicutes bacterium]|nr:cyclase family protein [Bacillota bacterium]
ITMAEVFAKGEDVAKKAEYLVFMTGWDKRWGDESYFGDYPVVTDEVADFAIETGKKGLAFDVIGLDPISDLNLTLHKKVFAASDMVIIENLCNLDKVEEAAKGEVFTLVATPIKYKNADGAPIRALAMI